VKEVLIAHSCTEFVCARLRVKGKSRQFELQKAVAIAPPRAIRLSNEPLACDFHVWCGDPIRPLPQRCWVNHSSPPKKTAALGMRSQLEPSAKQSQFTLELSLDHARKSDQHTLLVPKSTIWVTTKRQPIKTTQDHEQLVLQENLRV
jgi:hypothetical protein